MVDGESIARANEALDRLDKLDRIGVSNARAFRALLEDLHSRDLSAVQGAHVDAVSMVRAGILRAAISAIMSCLDPADPRGNRASVGQVLRLLEQPDVIRVFSERSNQIQSTEIVHEVRHDYDALIVSDLYDRGRRLRNEDIAHLLIPLTPTPTVEYTAIYKLSDLAEQFAGKLCCAVGYRTPHFVELRNSMESKAKHFWDAYFRGMTSG